MRFSSNFSPFVCVWSLETELPRGQAERGHVNAACGSDNR